MVADPIELNVWVTDVWDRVTLAADPGDTIATIKARSLVEATGTSPDPSRYEMKFRGALIADETKTLANLAVPSGAPMIVLPARRRPVV